MSLTPLSRILQSFSAPISEEHGWGIIHQACVSLQTLDNSHLPILLVEKPHQMLLTDDGTIHQDSFTRPGVNRKRMSSFGQMVAELGVVVYTALDFSLAEEESRALSSGLEHLIDMMTSADMDNSQEMEDEGIGGDEEKGKDVVEKVLELCRHHLAVSAEAGLHYKGVVRALVAESKELNHFMSRLDDEQLTELDRDEWGIIWTNVMQQLRQGVKLKKVNYSKTPVEFSLTPYEMLMDDIRGKKYQLNPVKVPLEVQRGAREVILEFIRSRPPLKSVNSRKVLKKKIEFTPQEELMNQIRGDNAKLNLKKTSTIDRTPSQTEGLKLGKVISKSSPNIKKVIDLDESFAEDILNFDDCEEHNEEENDVVQESNNKVTKLFRENNPDINKNSIQPNNNCLKDEVSKQDKSKYSDWIKTLHTLDLSLAEVAHIRSQLTKAELEERDLPGDKKREFEKGRICFLCGQVRFGLFTWAVLCQLCKRYVCSSCNGKITLPSDKLKDILVCTLTTQLSKESQQESLSSTTIPNESNFSRSFERHSFRSTARSSTPGGPSRPRLSRAKSMDKSMVASIQAMRLTGGQSKAGIQHNVCKDCKDMLTSIIRAQRMAAKLDKMRGGFRRLGHGFDTMRE